MAILLEDELEAEFPFPVKDPLEYQANPTVTVRVSIGAFADVDAILAHVAVAPGQQLNRRSRAPQRLEILEDKQRAFQTSCVRLGADLVETVMIGIGAASNLRRILRHPAVLPQQELLRSRTPSFAMQALDIRSSQRCSFVKACRAESVQVADPIKSRPSGPAEFPKVAA